MANENYKVLIVDDEEDILEFLSYSLTKDGFVTKTAKSGIEAIALAKEFIPDVIVLDVMMPGIDGIETCTELRAIDELHNTMIIFLTARNEDYSQIAGFDAGCKMIFQTVYVMLYATMPMNIIIASLTCAIR